MTERQEKVKELIKQLAANFIETESNKTSLITVTNAEVSPDLRQATIFVTVFPEDKEDFALDFLKRNRAGMRHFIKKRMATAVIPFFEIEIDRGEKNRQLIEKLLREGESQ